eukprot:scaffold20664_cov84-Amphora_coffeaeformis.AAC.1
MSEEDRPNYLPPEWKSYYTRIPKRFPSREAFTRRLHSHNRSQQEALALEEQERPAYLPPDW